MVSYARFFYRYRRFSAYLNVGRYNVICVDWRQYSTDLSYAGAKLRAKHIAKDIAMVLNKITYNMTRGVDGLHLIGHSMGAHIVGFTGKILTDQIPRITGTGDAFIYIYTHKKKKKER